MSEVPSSPEAVLRLIAQTEAEPGDPAVARAWAGVARACEAHPYQRQWIEAVLGEALYLRLHTPGSPVAVLCNVARQCRCVGLAPLLAAQLDSEPGWFADADTRSLLGAIYELAPEHAEIERIRAHGRAPDVFPVAIHLLAARDPVDAATFIRSEIEGVLGATRVAGRVWDSLARLCVRAPAHSALFVDALAMLGDQARAVFIAAVKAAAPPDAIRALCRIIEDRWPEEERRVSQSPHPESIELVRAFVRAAQEGDIEAARELLVHPETVQGLGESAAAFAGLVQAGADEFLDSMAAWPVLQEVAEPGGPLGPSLADAVMFQFDVTVADAAGDTSTLPIVVLEYGDARMIALPVRTD